ncbi:MAG TPA: site-2 protease family protein [Tepidisphaeraceae bacterium]|nr:site-2 protease family protein [Tepidisphaeraceae bacterium]
MLQLRPTFSESWYRVVNLKPKLRATAQISRQYYRGERWYVVRDAASNQFHRLSDAAYRFVGLLDGTRTVGQAWDLVGGQLADDAPTQPEVIQILSQLYAANLIETDIPPDATILLRRHKKQMQRKLQGRLMNVLFPRIPLWDPDRFLVRWMPLARVLLSRLGAILWLVAVIAALAMVAPEWNRLKAQAYEAINISQHPKNFFWGFLVFWVIKFIHECGHAFACRRFGGEVHEMGIMFLVFIPTPYVDASTAWAFPNKWARMFVGAAGMVVEMFVAAICAIAWVYVAPGTLTSDLLCYAMIIASFTTVVFNANPLLRYDGYYMLSDYLEIPNLQMKSREYVLGLIKRHVFRIKPLQPLPPPMQRVQLFVYGVLSTIYRVFVGIMIILMVTWQVPILGVLMAIGGLVTWLVVPVVKLFKYLTIEPELHRKRGRAWAFSAAVATAAVVLIGLLPFPNSIYGTGIVEPANKYVLNAESPGWVKQILARDGQILRKGDVIMVCEDPELESRIKELQARIRSVQLLKTRAGLSDMAQRYIAEYREKAYQEQLDEALARKRELTIVSPIDGQLIAPELHHLIGRYIDKGTEIATVAGMSDLLVRATLTQSEAELAWDEGRDPGAEIRLASRPTRDAQLYTSAVTVIHAAQPQLPHPVVGMESGVPIDPRDEKGTRPLVQQFELRAWLSNPNNEYHPGQTAHVRLKLSKRPLIWQWGRRFWQLVQSQSNSKWL